MHPWEAWLGTRAVGQTESFAILTLASESPLLMTYFFHKGSITTRVNLCGRDQNCYAK